MYMYEGFDENAVLTVDKNQKSDMVMVKNESGMGPPGPVLFFSFRPNCLPTGTKANFPYLTNQHDICIVQIFSAPSAPYQLNLNMTYFPL